MTGKVEECLKTENKYKGGICLQKINAKIAYWSIGWMSTMDGPGSRVVLYMQGCPIDCPWCHSPHSKYLAAPLLVQTEKCRLCGSCVEICDNKVHSIVDGRHFIDRANCIRCGKCVEACPASNSGMPDSVLSLPTVLELVPLLFEKMRPQLDVVKKCGGITLSGGEALMQERAAVCLLKMCKEHHINTCVETSMLLPYRIYQEASAYTDCWLLGFRGIYLSKQEDKREALGRCRQVIEKMRSHGNPQLIGRFPVIKGYTDTSDILGNLKLALLENKIDRLEILPCNPHMEHYYRLLGEKPRLDAEHCIPDEREVEEIMDYFKKDGIQVTKIG